MERAGKSPIQIMVSPDTLSEIDKLIAEKRFASRSDFGLKAIERFRFKGDRAVFIAGWISTGNTTNG
jgi:Arc/MetJ-type ribon-helix-helix transcriptional regulator